MTRLDGAKRYAVPIVFVALLAVLDALVLTSDPDVFWHLRVGRSLLETRALLGSDVFSFSVAGAPWSYKDVVADMVLYAGFARLGYAWFVVLKIGAALSMGAACHFTVRPRDRNPLSLLTGTGLITASFWLIERPNLFSMASFAAALALLERARRAAGRSAWRAITQALVPVVGLNLVWTWMHPFAILGHGLLVAFSLSLASAWVGRRKPAIVALLGPAPSPRFLWATCGAAIASPVLSLLNPCGPAVFGGIFTVARSTELRQRILEWKQLDILELWSAFPVAVCTVAAAVLGTTFWLHRAWRTEDQDSAITLWQAVVLAAFVTLTLESVRWIPYVAIAASVAIATTIGEALRVWAPRGLPRGAVTLTGLVMIALLRFRQGGQPVAAGEDLAWSPRDAVAFARTSGLQGRVANSLELGGYILWSSWPEVRVLVDGRSQQVYSPEFLLRSLLAEHDAKTFGVMRREDGADWVLGVNRPEQVAYGFLARDPEWCLAYWSETAAVYVRRSAHPELALEAYRFVDPFDVPGSVAAALATHPEPLARERILTEVRRMLDASPDSLRANLALVALLQSGGAASRADLAALLARLLRRYP